MSWQAPGYAHRLDLGGGKTGRAFLAATEESGELVVIKYLSVEASAAERVRSELSELSSLDSAFFVSVREVIRSDDGVAIVMDPVNGVTLRALLRDGGALTAEAALLVFYETLAGLAAAHRAGITHGDYRPESVMISLTGASVMLDARAIAWTERDITLGSGVYLAPERWHAAEFTAAADVYAATVTFAEMLVGEPPYWEDSQLLTLRYRHEQEEIPVEGIPVGLRELLRLGMAKQAEARANAEALLAVVDVTAIAEYGSDWAETGRAALVSLVSSRRLAFGGVDVIEETEAAAAGELVELDDYYADAAAAGVVGIAGVAADEAVSADEAVAADMAEIEIEAAESAAAEAESAEAAAAEVVAAASEIVELAAIEEITAASRAAEEDVLTEEEERAVAEVEDLVASVEASEAIGMVVVEGMDIAATESEIAEIDETVVESSEGAVFESENAAGAFEEGAVAEGLIAEGNAAEGVAIGELAEEEDTGEILVSEEGSAASGVVAAAGEAAAESGGVATGTAKAPAAPVAVGEARVPFGRKHPWLVGTIAILIMIIGVGVAFGLTGGRSGTPNTPATPEAAITETATRGGVIPPASSPSTSASTGPASPSAASGGAPPAPSTGSPSASATGPAAGPGVAPSASSSSHKSHASHKPKPTPTPTKLPVTGSSTGYTFGLAGLLLVAGVVLVVVFRRRRA
jgi:LPXTG-motif cell wall-anchored protein